MLTRLHTHQSGIFMFAHAIHVVQVNSFRVTAKCGGRLASPPLPRLGDHLCAHQLRQSPRLRLRREEPVLLRPCATSGCSVSAICDKGAPAGARSEWREACAAAPFAHSILAYPDFTASTRQEREWEMGMKTRQVGPKRRERDMGMGMKTETETEREGDREK